ncbi:hypothetical protein PENTCL1PPCAC_19562, partial [Pristionchus entomophagus]
LRLENFRKAYVGGGAGAIQIARNLELERAIEEMAKKVKASHNQYVEEKLLMQREQANLQQTLAHADRLKSEVDRLQPEHKRLKAAAREANRLRHDSHKWRFKAAEAEETLCDMVLEKPAEDQKLDNATNLLRHAIAECSTNSDNAKSLEEKFKQKTNKAKEIRKLGSSAARLISDISRLCPDSLPADLRARLNGMPLDELLQMASSEGGDSDDDSFEFETEEAAQPPEAAADEEETSRKNDESKEVKNDQLLADLELSYSEDEQEEKDAYEPETEEEKM